MRNFSLLTGIAVLTACSNPCSDADSLLTLAHNSVEDNISTPATANFTRGQVQKVGSNNGMIVTGRIDVLNEQGIPVRSKYGVHVKCRNDTPFVAYAWIGEHQWGAEYLRNEFFVQDKTAAEAEAAAIAAEASLMMELEEAEYEEMIFREGKAAADEHRARSAAVRAEEERQQKERALIHKIEALRRDSLQKEQEALRAKYD